MKQEKKENRRIAIELLSNIFPDQVEIFTEAKNEKNWKFIQNSLEIAKEFIEQIKQGII